MHTVKNEVVSFLRKNGVLKYWCWSHARI